MTDLIDRLVTELKTRAEHANAIIAVARMMQGTAAYVQEHHPTLGVVLDIQHDGDPLGSIITLRVYPWSLDMAEDTPEGADQPDEAGAPWEQVKDVQFWPSFRAPDATEDLAAFAGGDPVQEEAEAEALAHNVLVETALSSDRPEEDQVHEATAAQLPEPASAAIVAEKPAQPPRWTPAEDLLLLSAKAKAVPVADIAARLGRAITACNKRTSDLRLRGVTVRTLRAVIGPDALEWGTAPPDVASAPEAPAAAEAEPEPEPAPEAAAGPAPPMMPVLSGSDRAVMARLQRLMGRDGWTPDLDHELLTRLTRGEKLHVVATDLGLDTSACRDRFAALVPEPGIEAQAAVLRILDTLRRKAA